MNKTKLIYDYVKVHVNSDDYESHCIRFGFIMLLQTISAKWPFISEIDGLMQERRNSIDNALELHLSCTNPSKCVLAKLCLPIMNGASACNRGGWHNEGSLQIKCHQAEMINYGNIVPRMATNNLSIHQQQNFSGMSWMINSVAK